MLQEFEAVKLNVEKLLSLYKKYSKLPYSALSGNNDNHATKNMSAVQNFGESVPGFGCLLHKLQLLIEHTTIKHRNIVE